MSEAEAKPDVPQAWLELRFLATQEETFKACGLPMATTLSHSQFSWAFSLASGARCSINYPGIIGPEAYAFGPNSRLSYILIT